MNRIKLMKALQFIKCLQILLIMTKTCQALLGYEAINELLTPEETVPAKISATVGQRVVLICDIKDKFQHQSSLDVKKSLKKTLDLIKSRARTLIDEQKIMSSLSIKERVEYRKLKLMQQLGFDSRYEWRRNGGYIRRRLIESWRIRVNSRGDFIFNAVWLNDSGSYECYADGIYVGHVTLEVSTISMLIMRHFHRWAISLVGSTMVLVIYILHLYFEKKKGKFNGVCDSTVGPIIEEEEKKLMDFIENECKEKYELKADDTSLKSERKSDTLKMMIDQIEKSHHTSPRQEDIIAKNVVKENNKENNKDRNEKSPNATNTTKDSKMSKKDIRQPLIPANTKAKSC